MQIVNYIPLSSALVDVFDLMDENLIDEATVIEWASQAMRRLKVQQTLDTKVAFLAVDNHTAQLPCGLKYIDQIYYKETMDAEDLEQIQLYVSDADSNTISKKYMDFHNSDYYKTWKPIRLAVSNAFHLGIHCKNSINIYTKCEHEYSVNKTGTIKTSFKNGFLALTYLSFPMNEDGDFLIPDDIWVLETIKDWCLMKLWEKRMNMKEEGSMRLYEHYRRAHRIGEAEAKGRLLLPKGVDGYENLKQQLLRLGQHTNQYYSGFGNLNAGEVINLNHY